MPDISTSLTALDTELDAASEYLLLTLDRTLAIMERVDLLEKAGRTVESLELAIQAALSQIDVAAADFDTLSEERKEFVERFTEEEAEEYLAA